MKILIVSLLLLSSFHYLLGENLEKINPYLNSFLSWHLSGFGQLVAKEYKKGSLFVLGDILLKGLGLYITSEFEEKYPLEPGGFFNWEKLKDSDKVIVITYLTSFLIFRILNTIDAFISARKYNQKIELLSKKDKNSLKIEF
jgi:hypothetical protein